MKVIAGLLSFVGAALVVLGLAGMFLFGGYRSVRPFYISFALFFVGAALVGAIVTITGDW